MNRLTKRYNNGIATLDADAFMETQETIDREIQNCYPIKTAVERLAEYEDAEENGLLVRLPCKVGDTVYIKDKPVEVSFIHIENKDVTYCAEFDCVDCYVCPFYEDIVSWEGEHDCATNGYLEFMADDIGKSVFLTREEAEQALKEAQK